jgi:hypothetical protein
MDDPMAGWGQHMLRPPVCPQPTLNLDGRWAARSGIGTYGYGT